MQNKQSILTLKQQISESSDENLPGESEKIHLNPGRETNLRIFLSVLSPSNSLSDLFLGSFRGSLSALIPFNPNHENLNVLYTARLGEELFGTFVFNGGNSPDLKTVAKIVSRTFRYDITVVVARIGSTVLGFFRSELIKIALSLSQIELLDDLGKHGASSLGGASAPSRHQDAPEPAQTSPNPATLLEVIQQQLLNTKQIDKLGECDLILAYLESQERILQKKKELRSIVDKVSRLANLIRSTSERRLGIRVSVEYGPLLHRAAYEGYERAVCWIGKGSKLDQADDNGMTALGLAVLNSHPSVVEQLLISGADINTTTGFCGFTPLHLAAALGNEPILQLLINRKADVYRKGTLCSTALHLGVYKNQITSVRLLTEKAPSLIEKEDKHENTALDIAASLGHEEIAALLIDKMNSSEREKAWFKAARFGHTSVINLLLQKGIDIDHVDNFGYTALHHAASLGCIDAIQFLLNRGADLNKKTSAGARPIDSARARKHENAANLFTSAEEERSLRIDPQFVYMKMMRKQNVESPPYVTTKKDELFVTASVTDLEKWKNYKGVFHDSEIPIGDAEWIVTGRVEFNRFEALSVQPFVSELSVSSPVSLEVKDTKKPAETTLSPIHQDTTRSGGKGVYLGIIDSGCFFTILLLGILNLK